MIAENGYNFVCYAGRIYALPQSLGPVDVTSEEVAEKPGVVVGDDLRATRKKVALRVITTDPRVTITPMTSTSANIAFYGRNHPAYSPLFSASYADFDVADAPSSFECTTGTLRTFDDALQGFRLKMHGLDIPEEAIEKFIETRDYLSLLIGISHGGIHWFQGAPLTLGYRPWVIQIEKSSTLWLPFFAPGATYSFNREKPIFHIVRSLVTSDECVGIITNIELTKTSLPVLFDAPELEQKVFHLPFVTEERRRRRKVRGRFLFTTSWHQHRASFYNRGGVDAILIFNQLACRHSGLELVVRCNLPDDLPEDVRSALRAPNVHIISEKLDSRKMEMLFAESEFYLLPAASLHSMSTLEAMAHGCICILADAWGNEEYLHHGVNGLRLSGRKGRHWRFDSEHGILIEQYSGMEKPDPELIGKAVAEISQLMLDEGRRMRIAETARAYAAERHSVRSGRERFSTIVHQIRQRLARMYM